MPTRDVIVIGSSMGGIEALSTLVRHLPGDLAASVLVVQHTAEDSPGLMSEILGRRGALPAVRAEDGLPLEHGVIYVAPPDRHLIVTNRGVGVVFGPRENRARPAIDPLFRTAAVHCRSRVIGVVLTGLLNDGAAGLLAVAQCGGLPVVQSPDDAAHPDMPLNALATVPSARQIVLPALGAFLAESCLEAAPAPPPVPDVLRLEAQLTERTVKDDDWHMLPGEATAFTCPECNGSLKKIDDAGLDRYRCRVGHAYSYSDMLKEKAHSVEQSLWVAMQTLEERAQMLDGLARSDRTRGRDLSAAGFDDRARETRAHAHRLRDLLELLPA
jgi:two-component system, chemotaxis family, protein-glutamate methylesterase/glutaminase